MDWDWEWTGTGTGLGLGMDWGWTGNGLGMDWDWTGYGQSFRMQFAERARFWGHTAMWADTSNFMLLHMEQRCYFHFKDVIFSYQ
jgi:hypothetical protein